MRLRETLIVLACGVCLAVNSMAAGALYHLDIAPGALTSALDLLARQTHLEFIYSADELAGLRTRGVRGDVRADAAIEKLLRGTGLVVKTHPTGALLITRAQKSSAVTRVSSDHLDPDEASGPAKEIIVSASRRAERLSEVAGAVSVVSGSQLEERSANELADYVGFLPGVGTQSFGHTGFESAFVRGIAAQSVGATLSTYVDEVPVGPASALTRGGLFTPDLDPSDLEHVEALKGPQGTLYGASSLGGVLKYVTRSPDLSRAELHFLEAFEIPEGGSAGTKLRATGSLPLIPDTLAVRLSGYYRHVGGFIDDVGVEGRDVNRANDRGYRATFLYRPFSTLSLTLKAMDQANAFHGNDVVDYDLSTGRPRFGASARLRDYPEPSRTELQLYSAELNYGLRWFDLIAATSYSVLDPVAVTDLTKAFMQVGYIPPASTTVAASTYDERSSKLTQEIRLVAPRLGRLEWMLGGFFQHETLGGSYLWILYDPDGHAIAPPFGEMHRAGSLIERAGFANATLYLPGSLDITAGVRLSNVEQASARRLRGGFNDLTNPLAELVARQAFSETPATYLVAARWRPATNPTLYGRAASGYRPGGARTVPLDAPPDLPDHYTSDSIWSYETGLKLHAFDERLDVDLAAFWIDWTRIQTVQPVGAFVVDGNAGRARSRGVELQAQYTPREGLEFGANCAFTDAEFTESVPATHVTAGEPLFFVPRWTTTLFSSYSRRIAERWRMQLAADFQHQSTRLDIAATPMPPYSLWNARIAFRNERSRVTLYVKNVTDKQALLGFGQPGLPSQYGFAVNPPRTVGVALTQDLR